MGPCGNFRQTFIPIHLGFRIFPLVKVAHLATALDEPLATCRSHLVVDAEGALYESGLFLRLVALWYENNQKQVDENVTSLKAEGVAHDVAKLLGLDADGGLDRVQQLLQMLSTRQREQVSKVFKQLS